MIGDISMSDEANASPSNPIGSTILDNPQIYALLMSTIDERVAAGIRKRNEGLWSRYIGVVTIAVFVFTAVGATTLRYFVDDAVRETVGSAVDAVRFDSGIAELNFRVLSLDNSKGFTQEEAESIIWAIGSLTSEEPDPRKLEKLGSAVDTATSNFVAANRLDLVWRLERIVPDRLMRSGTVTGAVLPAIGYTLLADAGAPTSWTKTGSRTEMYKNYRKYVDRAEPAGYPEFYLLFEILLGYIEERPAGVIDNLIQDTDSLSDPDAMSFIDLMTRFATEGFTTERNAASKRVADIVKKFLCEYGERGELLRHLSEQAEIRC